MKMPLIKPKALNPGDTIGIVSPGRWMAEEDLAYAAGKLKDLGFNVYMHPQNARHYNQFAGSDECRADAIEELFADNNIGGIMCACGGVGSLWLLDRLHYDVIQNNPKIFCGFSDITALNMAIYGKTGLSTFHGPMLHNLRKENNALTTNSFTNVVEGGLELMHLSTEDGIAPVHQGSATAPLIGGNLALLINLIGTPYDVSYDGHILFIEDVDEYYYSLDRMLLHLQRAGKLKNIKGLIVGEVEDIHDNERPYGFSLQEMIEDVMEGLDIPVVMDVPCGHGKDILTFPMGVPAKLDVTANETRLTLQQPATAP